MFVKLSNIMSLGRAFDSLFSPEEKGFLHNDCPRERAFPPWNRVLGGMLLDEIDTIKSKEQNKMPVIIFQTYP